MFYKTIFMSSITFYLSGCLNYEKETYKIRWDGQILSEFNNFYGDEEAIGEFVNLFESIKSSKRIDVGNTLISDLSLTPSWIYTINNVNVNIYLENQQLHVLLLGEILQEELELFTHKTKYGKVYRVLPLSKKCKAVKGIPNHISNDEKKIIITNVSRYMYQIIEKNYKFLPKSTRDALEKMKKKDFDGMDAGLKKSDLINKDVVIKHYYRFKHSKDKSVLNKERMFLIWLEQTIKNLRNGDTTFYSFEKSKFPITIECKHQRKEDNQDEYLYRFSEKVDYSSGFNLSKKIMEFRFKIGI